MSLSTNTTYRLYAEKLGGTDPSQFVGNEGEVFLNPSVPTLKLSDGSTAGGVDIGGGGGIGTDGSVNTTGIITASSFSGTTASFSGNISVGGTLTYDDVTNVDSIGLITARTGIEVLSGIVTTPKLHVDSVGSGITFSEDLVVQGNARVTGILSIGTSSIILDSNAKVIHGVEQIRIHSPEQNAKPIIIRQVEEKIVFRKTEFDEDGTERELEEEASVGIGSTASINTTGIITASQFVGDGSGLTNLPASDVTSVNTLTGAVSLGVEDLDDFALQAASNQIAYHDTKTPGSYFYTLSTQGGWLDESNFTGINFNRYYPTSGTSLGDQGFTAGSNVNFWISTDGVTYTQHTASSASVRSDNVVLFSNCSPDLTAYSSATAFYVSLTDPSTTPSTSLADGDILQYESSASKFRPKKIDSLGIDIMDLDNVEKLVDSSNATWTYSSSAGSVPPSGQAGRTGQYGYNNVIFFSDTSSSGADYSTIFDNLNGKTISFYYDNVFAFKSTVTTNNNSSGRIGIKPIATYSGSFSVPADGTVIRIDFPDSPFFPLADGDILQYVSAESKFKPAQLSTIARAEVSGITTSIADAASADLTITNTGKAGQLLSIETDAAAWVTLYVSQATRTADASRTETTDPAAGSGVISEVITTGAQTVLVTPSTMYFNNESTPASELYLKVVNKSGSSAAITVTLKVISTEV